MGGKSGGDQKTKVTEYKISAHYGVCHGPIDEVRAIYYGEKKLWSGSETGYNSVTINKPNLFGGRKKEGGFVGSIFFLPGSDDQYAPEALVSCLQRNGASGATDVDAVPGYRGIFSFFVTGGGSKNLKNTGSPGSMILAASAAVIEKVGGSAPGEGASIGYNTPRVKKFWCTVRRSPKGCPFNSTITVDGMELANPAAIIYECLTNREWGMGGSESNIDVDSFEESANTLEEEGFGIAIIWNDKNSIEDFVSTILDHIEASLALDPSTGKFRLKLVRGDYSLDDLPVFDESNCTLKSYDRKGWGETINEIVVEWTNPANEKTETVSIHDTAKIQAQGGTIISETRSYRGIRTPELAMRVAARDLRVAGSALASAEIEADRSAWKVLPGDVVLLSWPKYGYDMIPMRVMSVDQGAPGDSAITLSLTEDVFGEPVQSHSEPPQTGWVSPSTDPEPLEREHITSAPYYLVAGFLGDDEAEQVPDTSDYDCIFGTTSSGGAFDFEVVVERTSTGGDTVWESLDEANPAGYGELKTDLPAEVESTIEEFDSITYGGVFMEGTLLWIGSVDEDGELAYIRSIDDDGMHVVRGIYDTVPQDWPAETPVWGLYNSTLATTGVERSLEETAAVRLLTSTSGGKLELDDASDVTTTMTGRMHRPYRPANLRAFGELWPDKNKYPDYPVEISWSHRNRVTEISVVNSWDDESVTPEEGTEYRVLIEAIQEDGTVDGEIEDTTTTETTYTLEENNIPADLVSSSFIRATITAKREGLNSLQSPSIRFKGPFKEPTDLVASYRAPTAPKGVREILLQNE